MPIDTPSFDDYARSPSFVALAQKSLEQDRLDADERRADAADSLATLESEHGQKLAEVQQKIDAATSRREAAERARDDAGQTLRRLLSERASMNFSHDRERRPLEKATAETVPSVLRDFLDELDETQAGQQNPGVLRTRGTVSAFLGLFARGRNRGTKTDYLAIEACVHGIQAALQAATELATEYIPQDKLESRIQRLRESIPRVD